MTGVINKSDLTRCDTEVYKYAWRGTCQHTCLHTPRQQVSNMVSAFAGKKYQLDVNSGVNFDEYMKALGVGDKGRDLAAKTVVTFLMTINGDTYTLEHTSDVKNLIDTFKLGQEFDMKTADGRDVKVTVTVDGNKLIEVQKGAKTTTIVREFSATEMKTSMVVDGVTANRVYKAL